MSRPRSTTGPIDEFGATLAEIKARLAAMEIIAHTPCDGGGGGSCPCPENVLVAGDTMTGFLTLSANPVLNLHAATKQYVDTGDAARVAIAGDTMTGFLTLNADPVNALHAATKQYVDNVAATKVNVSGDIMTGYLTLNADPTLALHAATKQYVDTAVAGGGGQTVQRNLTYLIMEVNP